MRAYYLIPESTAERVLTGIKPKYANPASPRDGSFGSSSTRFTRF